MSDDIKVAIADAVKYTMKKIGLENFKKTSFFVKNVINRNKK